MHIRVFSKFPYWVGSICFTMSDMTNSQMSFSPTFEKTNRLLIGRTRSNVLGGKVFGAGEIISLL